MTEAAGVSLRGVVLLATVSLVGLSSGAAAAAPEEAVADCHKVAPAEPASTRARPPAASAPRSAASERVAGRTKHSDRFPNVSLLTQHEESVQFYDDLVRDRVVIVNFMYATCENICLPIAQNLGQVHKRLGERMGRDIMILSLTIDSDADDPAALRDYIARNGGEKEGWVYLTGDYDDIDRVRRALGVYDLDPVIDADKSEHSGLITFGNDRTDQWAALPALMNSEEIAETVLRITHDPAGADS